jgi:hypothetical protein
LWLDHFWNILAGRFCTKGYHWMDKQY